MEKQRHCRINNNNRVEIISHSNVYILQSVLRRPFPQCRGVVRSWGRGRRCRLLLQRICHCSGLPDRRGAAGRTGVFLHPCRRGILLPIPAYRVYISRSEIQDHVLYTRKEYKPTG